MSKLRSKKQTDGMHIDDIENDLSFSYVINSDDRLVLQATMKILSEQERRSSCCTQFQGSRIARSLKI
jgi:hypothetical protein